ncbi:MAG: glycoside hydrolase family 2 protein [Clostridia bacterium]
MIEKKTIGIPDNHSEGRIVLPILESWRFYKGDSPCAVQIGFDDSGWEPVCLPHTWNRIDGEDGGNDYYRGTGWYRTRIRIGERACGKRIYIEFKGVNSQMELFVNGTSAGTHKGGYTAFRFEITNLIVPGTDNLLAVAVSNRADPAIAPLSGDFTFFGGIYREVSLIFLEPVHIDLENFGSSGVFLTARCDSGETASLKIESCIKNDSAEAKTASVKITLRHPERFEQNAFELKYLTPLLRFDPKDLCGGGIVETRELTFQIGAYAGAQVSETIDVASPHLWNGLADPYRYQVQLDVRVNGVTTDSFTGYIGFRSFSIRKDSGFYLNGNSYPLRGVAMHQDYQGKGNAVTFDEITQSFSFLYEIGANTVRLSHYPHNPYTYELCDKYGIAVYAEIPFVNTYGGSGSFEEPDSNLEEFIAVTKQQLTEMIRQQYNVCAIFCWGLYNEAQKADHKVMVPLIHMLNALAHTLDGTRRTVTATFSEEGEVLQSDLLAWNTYPPPGGLQANAERFYSAMDGKTAADHLDKYASFYLPQYEKGGFYSGVLDRPVGISEYGVGGSIAQHTDDYTQGSDTIKIQTEEFQAYCHETWLNQIQGLDYLWGTYVWNLFDFSADNRDEATVPGVNTKGLVTRGRTARKDAFYLYKAFWRNDLHVLSIAGKNHTERFTNPAYFKIYSNCDAVTLFVDGKPYGTYRQEENALRCVFVWPWKEELSYGEHRILASGWKDGVAAASDEMVLTRRKRCSTQLHSELLRIDAPPHSFSVTVPAEECGHEKGYLTDGNPSTRWAGSAPFPAELLLDLGEPAYLCGTGIDWFEARAYRYRIYASENGSDYAMVADHTANSKKGAVHSSFRPIYARYIKIEIIGSSDCSSWISAYAIRLDAWRFRTSYLVEDQTHTICVPYNPEIVISKEEFIAALGLEGNCKAYVETGGGATVYYITDGAALIIRCGDSEVRYKIIYR